MLRRLTIPAILVLLMLGAFVFFLTLLQDTLLFFPQRITEREWRETGDVWGAQTMEIAIGDAGHLRGWLLTDGTGEPRPTVLFFGGNAMTVRDAIPALHPLTDRGVHVLLIDYRGYGAGDGSASVRAIKNDGPAIFDAAAAHPLVDAERIAAWGLSIGAGAAAHLASVRPVEKIVLFAPFTSIAEVASRSFPFLPKPLIRWMLRDDLPTITLAPLLTQPALIVHGADDRQIPPRHAEAIARAWGGEADLLIMPDRGHQDLLADETAWQHVHTFLERTDF